MKILAIGNSFSVDALHYFSEITNMAGLNIKAANLYIGGCSLQQHADNLNTNSPDYTYYLNGIETDRKVSIRETLQEERWDIVTIQQASHDSGILQSYEPFGTELITCIQTLAPNAQIWFQKTWAYEHGSDHPEFKRYDCDQERMYRAITNAVAEFAKQHKLPVMPAGDVIQTLRKLPEFDYLNGGESLCRDGFHMSMTYGRYAVAATWAECLLNMDIRKDSFSPPDTDAQKMKRVRDVVHNCCR